MWRLRHGYFHYLSVAEGTRWRRLQHRWGLDRLAREAQ